MPDSLKLFARLCVIRRTRGGAGILFRALTRLGLIKVGPGGFQKRFIKLFEFGAVRQPGKISVDRHPIAPRNWPR